MQSQLSSSRLSASNTITVGLGSETKRNDEKNLERDDLQASISARELRSPSFDGERVNREYSGSSMMHSQSLLASSRQEDEDIKIPAQFVVSS